MVLFVGEKETRRTYRLKDLRPEDQQYVWNRWVEELEKAPLQMGVALPLQKPSSVRLPGDQPMASITVQVLQPKTDNPIGRPLTRKIALTIDGRAQGLRGDFSVADIPYERGLSLLVTASVRAAFEGEAMQQHTYQAAVKLPRPSRDGPMHIDLARLKLLPPAK